MPRADNCILREIFPRTGDDPSRDFILFMPGGEDFSGEAGDEDFSADCIRKSGQPVHELESAQNPPAKNGPFAVPIISSHNCP